MHHGTSVPAFVSALATHNRRSRHPPRCEQAAPKAQQAARTRSTREESIPSGARPEPVHTHDSPLEHRLSTLSFAYERPQIALEAANGSCTLRYRCKHGHIVNCRRGSAACAACPTCSFEQGAPCTNNARRKLSLCRLQAEAKERGGTLLSTVYRDARTPLIWRCHMGHVWKATASNIRSARSWCPECARQRRKLTIEDMRELARSFGGECVSKSYISEHVRLTWRCEHGHEFLMAPNNIRRSAAGARKPSWCKVCRRNGVPLPEAVMSQ